MRQSDALARLALLLLPHIAAADPQCDGTLSANGRACCPISCGETCGGAKCAADATPALSPEVKARCCPEKLLTVAPPCTEAGGAPCVMPVQLQKGQIACSSGLDNDLPYESCLSYCTMNAHCVKCKCKACNVCQGNRPPLHPIAKPPSPPMIYASSKSAAADALGCVLQYSVTRFDPKSFSAQVTLNMWVPGMKVLVDYGPNAVEIANGWGADPTRIAGRGYGYLFVLRRAPDQHGGFGFNGRGGFPNGAPVPEMKCVSDPPPPPPPKPPYLPPPPRPPPPPSPPPSPPPPPPPPVSVYAPKRVEHLQVTSSTCASASMQWHAAAAVVGHAVQDYEVSVQRAEEPEKTHQGIKGTTFEATGLLPSTSYALRVRARANVGPGPFSSLVTVTTYAGTRPPEPPYTAPKPHTEATAAGEKVRDCSAIELKLPPLRPGCGGDEKLTVEMSDGGAWLPAVEDVKAKTATVPSLDPYIAYRFRVTASNAAGVSSPGPESAPILTDAEGTEVGKPPTATATSSASISVSWPSSPCRPQLTYEVLYAKHDGGGAASLDWQTLAKSVSGSSYEVQSLRCPTGCVFRTRPLEVRGLADAYSRPSAVVRTKTLPRAPTGAVRVELKLSEELPPEHSGLQSHLATDLALALEVDKSRIDIVEVRRKGLFFIFDLLAADGSAPTPEDLAHSLARLAGNQRSVLYEGSLTRGVDPKAPPLFVLADGSVAPIEAPDTIASLAGRFTFAIASVIAITACATVFLRTLNAGGGANGSGGYGGGGGDGKPSRRRTSNSKRRGGATYGSVEDDFDDDDDWDDEPSFARNGRRA